MNEAVVQMMDAHAFARGGGAPPRRAAGRRRTGRPLPRRHRLQHRHRRRRPAPPPRRSPPPRPRRRGRALGEAERETLQNWLATDPETKKLYGALVLSGGITEADFFHQKKHAYATSMQKRGFSTERQSATAQRVADVVTGEAKLAAKAGETYKFHLSVTRMQAIFAEKPEVHRLFLAKVPHEMSEKAFWTAYLRKQEKKKLEQQAKAEAWRLYTSDAADDRIRV